MSVPFVLTHPSGQVKAPSEDIIRTVFVVRGKVYNYQVHQLLH
jgi:hypothetical protein